jgi:hypothetical protein
MDMTIILDSPRQILGDMGRCPKCLSYVDINKCEKCPLCGANICYHCGNCHCPEDSRAVIERKLRIWANQDLE